MINQRFTNISLIAESVLINFFDHKNKSFAELISINPMQKYYKKETRMNRNV